MITNLTETIYAARQLSAERAQTAPVLDFGPLPTAGKSKRTAVVAMLAKTGLRCQAAWQPFSRWFRQTCLTQPYNFTRNI